MKAELYLHWRLNFLSTFLLILSFGSSQVYAQTGDSVIFRDDFNKDSFGTLWHVHGSWSILNGSAYNFIDGFGGALKTTSGYTETSYIIVTTARGFTSNYYREFRITFGQSDLSKEELYQVTYTAYGGGTLTLSRSSDNVYFPAVLDEAAIFPALNSSAWYKFKIARYKSGLIQVYLDQGLGYGSEPLLEAIDSAYSPLGHIGWQVDTQTFAEDFFVDWISARKPDVEKPAIKEKPVEDNLITQVSAKSRLPYKVAKLTPGVKQLIDREYTITSVPEYLKGASFIQSANADKSNTTVDFLTFFIKKPAIIYIGFDSRSTAIPEWLSSWTKTGDSIVTTDEKAGHLNLYSKLTEGGGELYPFPNILGGNLAAPAFDVKTNYLVAAIEKPNIGRLQAEDALISGAVVANDHQNYNGTGFVDFKNPVDDYIEWTVNIDVPGTYNLGFSFANGGLEDRVLQITDNGINAGTATFSHVSPSWSAWAFISGPNRFLSRGVHKIRVTATGSSGPNIDELSLYFLSDAVPGSASAPVMVLQKELPESQASSKVALMSYKAYPNPFIQKTSIYYRLKEKSKVVLSVYTMQGQLVQLLNNGTREAGDYKATFDAGKLSKGMYFYRLEIGNYIKIGGLLKE